MSLAWGERTTHHECCCSQSTRPPHEFCARTRSSHLRQTGDDLLGPPHPTRHHLSVVFFTPQTRRTWCGLCSSAPCCCPVARLAVDYSHINGNYPVTGHRFFLQHSTTTKSSTGTTPNRPFTTNEQTPFQLKPLGAALRLKNTRKKHVSNIQRNTHKQLYDSLADTPVERAIILSQSTSHTGAHLMQPSSEAYEAEDRCFRVSVARRLMLPHPAAPNATDVVQSCPNKSAAGLICNKPVDAKQHHCYGCRYGGGVDRRHAAEGRCPRRRHPITQWRQGIHRTGSTCSHACCQRSE